MVMMSEQAQRELLLAAATAIGEDADWGEPDKHGVWKSMVGTVVDTPGKRSIVEVYVIVSGDHPPTPEMGEALKEKAHRFYPLGGAATTSTVRVRMPEGGVPAHVLKADEV